MDDRDNQMNAEEENVKDKKVQATTKFKKVDLIGKILLLVVLLGIGFIGAKVLGKDEGNMEVVTLSDLQKIIDISEFHTFQAVYNGIAEVKNEKDMEKIDYYVSYNAKVNAGFDFSELIIEQEDNILEIQIPEITIQDVIVDMGSLDYIFLNKKVNKSGVSDKAYDACIADVTLESSQEESILELAQMNAENTMKAIMTPFLTNTEYQLEVVFGGAR